MLELTWRVAGIVVAAIKLAVLYTLHFIRQLDYDVTHPLNVYLEDPQDVAPVQVPSIWASASKYLSVIIPAYNEEGRLGQCLDEIIEYLQRRRNRAGSHFTYEIIIVDDGSKDGTVRLGYEYVKKYGFDAIRLLRVPKNRGKGHAVKRGMLVARGEYCLFADADGATKFSDLERLESALKAVESSKGGDAPLGICCGSRAHMEKAAVAKRTAFRNFLMHGFHLLVLFVAGGQVKDTQCGFKLFTRRAAALVYSNQRIQRWCFDVELIYLARVFSIPVTETPVNWTEMPGSKIRFTSILLMAFEMTTIKLSYQWLSLWKVYGEQDLIQKVE